VKALLAIVCGLSLLLGQVFPAAAPVCTVTVKACCDCGGEMACCAEKSAPTAPAPATTERAGSENQLLAFVPATVVWVLAAAGTTPICPTNNFVFSSHTAPIFALHCTRLI
jgi:hypothetical protein